MKANEGELHILGEAHSITGNARGKLRENTYTMISFKHNPKHEKLKFVDTVKKRKIIISGKFRTAVSVGEAKEGRQEQGVFS